MLSSPPERSATARSAGLVAAGGDDITRISFGRVGDRFAVDQAEGVVRGALLGFLLAAAPRGRIAGVADLRRDHEALAVIGALFVEKLIGGRQTAAALRFLLQQRFEIGAR